MIFKLIAALILCVPMVAQTPTPKKTDRKTLKAPTKKTEPKDTYNPDDLPPGEVACGRIGSIKAPPCQCMRHRRQIQDEAMDKCQMISDRKERMTCLGNVPACPDVIDSEGLRYNDLGQPMAAHCKRSCRLARCECCHS